MTISKPSKTPKSQKSFRIMIKFESLEFAQFESSWNASWTRFIGVAQTILKQINKDPFVASKPTYAPATYSDFIFGVYAGIISLVLLLLLVLLLNMWARTSSRGAATAVAATALHPTSSSSDVHLRRPLNSDVDLAVDVGSMSL
jgi:hypothetical protein